MAGRTVRVMIDSVVAILLGVGIGLFSGLFGVGGSSISTPLLRIVLGTSPLIALGSPLPVALPTALSGSVVYRREGFINGRAVTWSIAGGVPTIVAGALLTSWVPAHGLMYLVAVSVMFAGLQMYRSRPLAQVDGQVPVDPRWANPSVPLLVAAAAVIGFLSGLLANGGGFLLVPVFVLLFGARLREAAATSLPCVAAMAVPGTITHALLGHVDWLLALELSIGVVPATYVGARASIWLRNVRLRKPFGVFMVVFGVYFFFRELLRG
jgi:uncharacterized membrane protein YfcA